MYFTNQIYDLLNHGPYVLVLKTPIDDLIPVVAPFSVPYVSLDAFVYASLILFLVFRTRIFRATALSMIAAWFVSYAFYFFLQSYVARPILDGSDFFTNLIRSVYARDNPFNCFPSLHTSISTIIAFHWWRVNKAIGIPVAVWACLIVLSTVFVKQHYIADVGAGLVLAFSVSILFAKLIPDSKPAIIVPDTDKPA